MTHRSKSPGGDPVEVSIGAFLPPVTILSQPANGSRHDWTGVTATFPNPPTGAALANGLITVRLRVPKAGVTCEIHTIVPRLRVFNLYALVDAGKLI
jgi:hypothetical protein